MEIKKENRKLIVKPQFLTWYDAKNEARLHCGRLLRPREIERWAKKELINVDVWLDFENEGEPDYANYYDSKGQTSKYQPKVKLALLVILADRLLLEAKKKEVRERMERSLENRKNTRRKQW